MPQETRRIEFSEEEVGAALSMFIDSSDRFAATRQEIADIRLGDGRSNDGIAATIRLHGDKPDIELSESMIAAAIVSYCMATAVPLPRAAKKTLKRANSAFVLVTEI